MSKVKDRVPVKILAGKDLTLKWELARFGCVIGSNAHEAAEFLMGALDPEKACIIAKFIGFPCTMKSQRAKNVKDFWQCIENDREALLRGDASLLRNIAELIERRAQPADKALAYLVDYLVRHFAEEDAETARGQQRELTEYEKFMDRYADFLRRVETRRLSDYVRNLREYHQRARERGQAEDLCLSLPEGLKPDRQFVAPPIPQLVRFLQESGAPASRSQVQRYLQYLEVPSIHGRAGRPSRKKRRN